MCSWKWDIQTDRRTHNKFKFHFAYLSVWLKCLLYVRTFLRFAYILAYEYVTAQVHLVCGKSDHTKTILWNNVASLASLLKRLDCEKSIWRAITSRKNIGPSMSLRSDDLNIDEENAQPKIFPTSLLSSLCNIRRKRRNHSMTEEKLIPCANTHQKIRQTIVLRIYRLSEQFIK